MSRTRGVVYQPYNAPPDEVQDHDRPASEQGHDWLIISCGRSDTRQTEVSRRVFICRTCGMVRSVEDRFDKLKRTSRTLTKHWTRARVTAFERCKNRDPAPWVTDKDSDNV